MHSKRVIAFSGRSATGKTTLAQRIAEEYKAGYISTSHMLKRVSGVESRRGLVDVGDQVDRNTNYRWLANLVHEMHCHTIVVDSVRNLKQLCAIQALDGVQVIPIHIMCQGSDRDRRLGERDEAHANEDYRKLDELESASEFAIITNERNVDDCVTTLTAFLPQGRVDVLFGGQYGSEGKGNIISKIAGEYEVFCRTGGPNAGHQVKHDGGVYCYYHIPSAMIDNPTAVCIIGGSALINPDKLRKEIEQLEAILGSRINLAIDPRAMLIEPGDIQHEESGVRASIGSTAQGVGSAQVRRVMRNDIRTAQDDQFLKKYCSDWVPMILQDRTKKVLIEGTQGFGLSLYHGHYPYCTSRDNSPQALLSEIGIPIDRVCRIISVMRTYPIRVQSPEGGTSGPMAPETNLQFISEQSGIDLQTLEKLETTSTTKRKRRISQWDRALAERTVNICSPTDIALTFVDYLGQDVQKVNKWGDAPKDHRDFVDEVTGQLGVPVTLLSTGFGKEHVIDRRREIEDELIFDAIKLNV